MWREKEPKPKDFRSVMQGMVLSKIVPIRALKRISSRVSVGESHPEVFAVFKKTLAG